jgi:hypothetical protein
VSLETGTLVPVLVGHDVGAAVRVDVEYRHALSAKLSVEHSLLESAPWKRLDSAGVTGILRRVPVGVKRAVAIDVR